MLKIEDLHPQNGSATNGHTKKMRKHLSSKKRRRSCPNSSTVWPWVAVCQSNVANMSHSDMNAKFKDILIRKRLPEALHVVTLTQEVYVFKPASIHMLI